MEKAMRLVLSGSFHSLESLRRKIRGGIITQERTYSKLVDKRKALCGGLCSTEKEGRGSFFFVECQGIYKRIFGTTIYIVPSLRRQTIQDFFPAEKKPPSP